jgi:hypothetical protein
MQSVGSLKLLCSRQRPSCGGLTGRSGERLRKEDLEGLKRPSSGHPKKESRNVVWIEHFALGVRYGPGLAESRQNRLRLRAAGCLSWEQPDRPWRVPGGRRGQGDVRSWNVSQNEQLADIHVPRTRASAAGPSPGCRPNVSERRTDGRASLPAFLPSCHSASAVLAEINHRSWLKIARRCSTNASGRATARSQLLGKKDRW